MGGANTPLLWQVAATTKAQTTGNILYVDSTGADYTEGQINGETATRTTSTWEGPGNHSNTSKCYQCFCRGYNLCQGGSLQAYPFKDFT